MSEQPDKHGYVKCARCGTLRPAKDIARETSVLVNAGDCLQRDFCDSVVNGSKPAP